MKMATEQCDVDTTADEVDRRVDAVESDEFFERHVKRRLGGVSSRAVRSVACMYTVTPNGGFVVEETSPGLIVASACSGHGFKHSAALGEALADKACGGGSGSSASAALLGQVRLDGPAQGPAAALVLGLAAFTFATRKG